MGYCKIEYINEKKNRIWLEKKYQQRNTFGNYLKKKKKKKRDVIQTFSNTWETAYLIVHFRYGLKVWLNNIDKRRFDPSYLFSECTSHLNIRIRKQDAGPSWPFIARAMTYSIMFPRLMKHTLIKRFRNIKKKFSYTCILQNILFDRETLFERYNYWLTYSVNYFIILNIYAYNFLCI